MRITKKGKRLLLLALAFAMLLTMFPPLELKVTAGGTSGISITDDFESHKQAKAKFNPEYDVYVYMAEEPKESWKNAQSIDISNWLDLEMIVEDYYKGASGLWYKVSAAEGYTLPAELEAYPWIYQNDWDSDVYPNALIITPVEEPSYDVPETVVDALGNKQSIVSDSGITVATSGTELVKLVVAPSDYVPTAHYVDQFVVYQMTPKTDSGDYTDWATVTIPIPEGWDSSKVFGFVVEENGDLTAIPGEVTSHGTFSFTVPHFSDVGIFAATSARAVENVTITFGPVNRETHVYSFEGTNGTEGKYLSDDGKVEYVVNHATVSGAGYTYITFRGLDVTNRTMISVGDLQIVTIVEQATAEIDKLLAGTGTAASTTLYPMYDLDFSGDFEITYALTNGMDCVSLDSSAGKITSLNKEGTATVVATVKHKTSGSTVGVVTYNITTTTANVTAVKNIYVPKGGTVQIKDMTGALNNIQLDESIVTATYGTVGTQKNVLTLKGVADSGETSVIVGTTLFRIYAEPENPQVQNNVTISVLIEIGEIKNCDLYYAINGGTLHKLEQATSGYVLIGLSAAAAQSFPSGFNIMFFTAPKTGHTTSYMQADNTSDQFYALANGFRYDGSDSDAWPLNDEDANITSFSGYNGNSSIWKTVNGSKHGFRWPLLQGNMTLNEMRDLFTRALALGCDAATNFTRNDNNQYLEQAISFVAEELPTLDKSIVKVVDENGNVIADPENTFLHMGYKITYQIKLTIPSKYISYSNIEIQDDLVGLQKISFNHQVNNGNFVSTSLPSGVSLTKPTNSSDPYIYTITYDYTLSSAESEIIKYAGGVFTNTAYATYEYKSVAASSRTPITVSDSAAAKVGGIVTWMDNLGNVWKVDVPQGGKLTDANDPVQAEYPGYIWQGWQKENVVGLTKEADGSYTVSFLENKSIIILGKYLPIDYQLTYNLNGGTLPTGVNNPTDYNIETVLKLPIPSKQNYVFNGWVVTSASGNWTQGDKHEGGMVMPQMYGDVTLEAQWTHDGKTYTVTWKNWDGTELEKDVNVPSGTTPEYNGQTPTRPGTADRTYTFIGWTPEVAPVTGNVTYTAVYSDSAARYSVTFVDYDGTILKDAVWYDYGTPADQIAVPADPTRGDSAQYTYTFAGWTPTIASVTKNVIYTASYTATPKEYRVTWIVDGVEKVVPYKYGETIVKPTDLSKEGHTFAGWDKEIPATMPANDLTFTAQWSVNSYTVTWIVDSEKTIVTYAYGATIVKPADPAKEGYNFLGWSPAVPATMPAKNLEFTAKFEQALTTLTINVQGCDEVLDPNQSFLFSVTGEDGVNLQVGIVENGSVVIDGLTIGKEYTITIDNDWSWRYESKQDQISAAKDTDGAKTANSIKITLEEGEVVTFTVTRENQWWLDGWWAGLFNKN